MAATQVESNTQSTANTQQVESTPPSVPCTKGDVYGCSCPVCSPPKAQAPSSARNVQLKAMRAAVPAKGLVDSAVLVDTTAGIQRKAGSKAAKCVQFYTLGSTIGAIVASMPLELQSYGRACLLWDLRHGYITVK